MSPNWKKRFRPFRDSVRRGDSRDPSRPSDAVGPDDGIDPKLLFHASPRRRDDRAVRRLCSQVRETLTYALAGSCRDETLQSLYVSDVEPAPDATRLAVTVVAPADIDVAVARERLALVTGLLRAEVASSIHRRRAPELVFRVAPAPEERP